jgi:ribosome assembly protein YihI (activator of Der GTPase)
MQKEAEEIRRKQILEEITKPRIGSNEKIPFIEQALKLIETGDKSKTEEIRKLISKAGLGDQLRNTKDFTKLKAILDEGYKKVSKSDK